MEQYQVTLLQFSTESKVCARPADKKYCFFNEDENESTVLHNCWAGGFRGLELVARFNICT